MFRRAAAGRTTRGLLLAATGPYGTQVEYRPKQRPADLVMPIRMGELDDPENKDHPTAAYTHRIDRLMDDGNKPPVKLGSVPTERSVGDCYKYCLKYCKQRDWLACREIDGFQKRTVTPERAEEIRLESAKLAERQQQHPGEQSVDDLHHSPLGSGASLHDATANNSTSVVSQEQQHTSSIDPSGGGPDDVSTVHAEHIWDLLDAIPLPSPVYGALATRGRGLLRRTILSDVHEAFPRLRGRYANEVLHAVASTLPTTAVARRIGLVQFCNVETDVDLFREKTYLMARASEMRAKLKEHEQKLAVGNLSGQKLWQVKNEMYRLRQYLGTTPGELDELTPRARWVESHMHAFIGFVALCEGTATAKNMIRRLFTPSFNHPQPEDLGQHRIEAHQILDQGARESAAHDFAVKLGNVPVFVRKHEIPRKYKTFTGESHTVPAVLTLCMQPVNALREAQVILKYAHDVPDAIKGAPLDFEKEYNTIEDDDAPSDVKPGDMDSYTGSRQNSGTQAVVGRLMAGAHPIGEGTGEDIAMALQSAAKHTSMNYYFKRRDDV